MSSVDEVDINDVVSERETQFIPRSDDDEVLWDVQEITAERGKKYRVRWVGTDPATGKPWAQSWVAKHDCTDKLVADWKAKKRRPQAAKKRGRPRTASRATGSSRRAGSSTSRRKTRASVSEATSSRLDSVEQPISPPKKPAAKRKRQPETPGTTTTNNAGRAEEQNELSGPRKKQKMVLEALLKPISSDSGEGAAYLAELRSTVSPQKKALSSSNSPSADTSDEEDNSPPKAKSVHRSDARSKGSLTSSKASDPREESELPHSKIKTKVVARRKERITDRDAPLVESGGEEPRLSKPKKKVTPENISSPGLNGHISEAEAELTNSRIKIGPPRGVKRRQVRQFGSSRKLGSSHTRSREDNFAHERVPAEEPRGQPGKEAASPHIIQQDAVDSRSSTHPPPLSIPPVPPSLRSRSPNLSPGARARLELFDRMMKDVSQHGAAPPDDVPERAPDDIHFGSYDANPITDAFDDFDPPHPPSPPPSKSKPEPSKLNTTNGLIVPESESSGNSQGQTQSLCEPPLQLPPARDQSPRKPIDLPTIAVIAASAASSSVSPQDLLPPPQRHPLYTNRPSKRQVFKPVPQISPGTFRSTIKAHLRPTESEAPPSSIESFTSPKRVDKGKQRAVEDDELQSSLSGWEEEGERPKARARSKITDSELKKRGKQLFDQAQLMREAERQKKKVKRLKNVDDIVNGAGSSSPKRSSLVSPSRVKETLEIRWEDVADLDGGANSATLDTPEHSEPKLLSEEERECLRIKLRQEEEENTQEAMGIYPQPLEKASEAMGGDDVQMPPPKFPRNSSFSAQIEDMDHVEQPSTDLQKASVIVQASQEQQQEDTDIEPVASNHLTSSPPRRILENLTDSPKRRLGEALSLLNVKSEEIQRLERELADERKNGQGLKAELAEIRQSSGPTDPVVAAWEAERAQWAQERSKWENDLSTWQTERKQMSEEMARLSTRAAELSDVADRAEGLRVKLSELEAERVAWTKERDEMPNGLTVRPEELADLTKVRGEYDQDRRKWDTENASWATERASWETERAALQEQQQALLHSVDELTTRVESMSAAKVSAEKDREFFRQQYAQASGFVGSVREENLELEKRVGIAEGQAQEGVATIKAFFEGRVKALQADVERWKGLTVLLQEKDRRTGDELRSRAAQAPELAELCGRLTVENKTLTVGVRKLEQAQQRSVVKRNKLYYDIFALKKERVSLRSKLSQLVKMVGSSTQEISHSAPAPLIPENRESIDPNDMEILPFSMPQSSFEELVLFPCMWRPQCRDQCQHVFDTKEDLERHLQEHFRDLLAQ